MPSLYDSNHGPRWYLVPVRVLIVTFFVTLLSFAVSLFLGICTVLVAAKFRGVPPHLRMAYRLIALPAAAVVAIIVLFTMSFLELRNYRRARTLNHIEQQIERAG